MKRILTVLISLGIILNSAAITWAASDKINLKVDSEMTGNIFFDSDYAELTATFENNEKTEADLNVEYAAHMLDSGMNICADSVYTLNKSYNIPSGSFAVETLKIPIKRYGLYKLNIKVNGELAESIDFSKAVKNKAVNKTIGTNIHLTRYGRSDEAVLLMKNAGMGIVRDFFGWDHYEKTAGKYALEPQTIDFLNATQKNGIEVLASLYAENNIYDTINPKSQFMGTASKEQYVNFLKWFLSQDLIKNNVKKLEIMNEPDTKTSVDGEIVPEEDSGKEVSVIAAGNEKRAAAYMRLVEALNDALGELEERDNYKIGIPALCGPEQKKTKVFADVILNKLNSGDFDALAIHSYKNGNMVGDDYVYDDPEPGFRGNANNSASSCLSYNVNYYKALVSGESRTNPITLENEDIKGIYTGNKYNFKLTEPVWHTEFGYSSANEKNAMCVGDDMIQAALDIRTVNHLKENSFNDVMLVNEFSNENETVTSSIQEQNFGLVNSHTAKVPYSAKFGYLAFSNYNSLTANAAECAREYTKDFAYVSKYNAKDSEGRNVYMLWTSAESGEIEYDLTDDELYENGNIYYYDFLGNKLMENEVMADGKYNVTGEPFYAVVGKDVQHERKLYGGDKSKFIIKGYLPQKKAGSKISVVVTQEDIEFNSPEFDNSVLFAGQTVSGENGAYLIACKIPDKDRIKAHIASEEGEEIELIFEREMAQKAKITLMSGETGAEDISFSDLDLKDLSVKINFGNISENEKFMLFCGLYKENMLMCSDTICGNVKDNAEKLRKITFNAGYEGCDKLKLILVNDNGNLTPLCEAYIK